jgi:pyrroloquinoline quinone (PQQ) biosynthesis protein C
MGKMQNLQPHPPAWVATLHKYVEPYWNDMLNSSWAQGVASRRLSLSEMRGWILQLYPFIHAFPKFLAEGLIKVEDDFSRTFLINNIRVEKAHADHWLDMGEGFGIPRAEMMALAEGHKPIMRDVQSLSDWLWYINTKGTLPEAVAATSFAIEGVTGDIARQCMDGFLAYAGEPGVEMTRQASRWVREHAHYDDEHPKIALEIIIQYATTERLQNKVMLAAKRSLQLLELAFDTSYRAFTPARGVVVERDQRSDERRRQQMPIKFPERRLGERRGFHAAAH